MIYLDRSRVSKPPRLDLDNSDSVAYAEYAAAKQRFDAGTPMKSDEFKAYKSDAIKKELTKLSYGKCAYCESEISNSSQTDIEHFRAFCV